MVDSSKAASQRPHKVDLVQHAKIVPRHTHTPRPPSRSAPAVLAGAGLIAGLLASLFNGVLLWHICQATAGLPPGTCIRPMAYALDFAVFSYGAFCLGGPVSLAAVVVGLWRRFKRMAMIAALAAALCLAQPFLTCHGLQHVIRVRDLRPTDTWIVHDTDGDTKGDGPGSVLLERVRRIILDAKGVTYLTQASLRDPPAVVFDFRTDEGKTLFLWALPYKSIDGKPNHQEIRFHESWLYAYHFELKPGSRLEACNLRLLEKAKIPASSDRDCHWSRPTKERLDWLIKRIADRQTKWEWCPEV